MCACYVFPDHDMNFGKVAFMVFLTSIVCLTSKTSLPIEILLFLSIEEL
uniref:Uncharacterized protein n=1 Tax=Setaria italica TaxID=4555 RepID=K3ZGB0_SETIT